MQILVIGGGGREHALAWRCAQSARVRHVFVAPGNAGTAREPKMSNVALAADDFAGLIAFAQRERIDRFGPELRPRLYRPLLPHSVPEKGKDDDDRNRNAQQPQQNVAHDVLLSLRAQETRKFRSRSILAITRTI